MPHMKQGAQTSTLQFSIKMDVHLFVEATAEQSCLTVSKSQLKFKRSRCYLSPRQVDKKVTVYVLYVQNTLNRKLSATIVKSSSRPLL